MFKSDPATINTSSFAFQITQQDCDDYIAGKQKIPMYAIAGLDFSSTHRYTICTEVALAEL